MPFTTPKYTLFQYHLTLFTHGQGLVLQWSLKILCGFKRFASSFPENISIYPLFNLIKVEIDESKSDEIQLEIINNKGSYPTTSQPPPLGKSIST